ncbi:YicC/YloC family endoribonuclease [Rhodovibrionaceae bacterium A322]
MTSAAKLASMTGFGRAQGGDERLSWSWELKCVNGRGLDLRFRLPYGWESLELPARQKASKLFKRGNFQMALALRSGSGPAQLQINRELLDQVVAVARDLADEMDAAAPRVDGLLSIRGVVETVEDGDDEALRAEREKAILADFETALASLQKAREDEGTRLAALVESHLADIEGLIAEAEAHTALQPESQRQRLKDMVATLLEANAALPEERLAQEAALLITKADVREELDRLIAHVAAARELLAEGGPMGRKLDFLCQEFNREANTLCSKSPDVSLTRIGLDFKSSIEQLREQIQNIE